MSQFDDNPYSPSAEAKPQLHPPGMPLPQSGLAIGSMITGIIALVTGLVGGCCCIFIAFLAVPLGLTAIVMGYMGKQECDKGYKSGGGMALAGMICGGISLVLAALWGVLMALGIAANIGAQGLQP